MTDHEFPFGNWDHRTLAKCSEIFKNLVSESTVEDRYGFVKRNLVIWHDGLGTQYVSKG